MTKESPILDAYIGTEIILDFARIVGSKFDNTDKGRASKVRWTRLLQNLLDTKREDLSDKSQTEAAILEIIWDNGSKV